MYAWLKCILVNVERHRKSNINSLISWCNCIILHSFWHLIYHNTKSPIVLLYCIKFDAAPRIAMLCNHSNYCFNTNNLFSIIFCPITLTTHIVSHAKYELHIWNIRKVIGLWQWLFEQPSYIERRRFGYTQSMHIENNWCYPSKYLY